MTKIYLSLIIAVYRKFTKSTWHFPTATPWNSIRLGNDINWLVSKLIKSTYFRMNTACFKVCLSILCYLLLSVYSVSFISTLFKRRMMDLLLRLYFYRVCLNAYAYFIRFPHKPFWRVKMVCTLIVSYQSLVFPTLSVITCQTPRRTTDTIKIRTVSV